MSWTDEQLQTLLKMVSQEGVHQMRDIQNATGKTRESIRKKMIALKLKFVARTSKGTAYRMEQMPKGSKKHLKHKDGKRVNYQLGMGSWS